MRNHLAFFGREFLHLIVEMRNGDASVLIGHLADHFTKHIYRVGHRTAKVSGVQIAVGSGNFHFPISQSAKTGSERRQVLAQHTGIRHQNHIGLKQFLMLLQELVQTGRADFLLTLENEFHVVAQQTVAHQIFKSLDLNHSLSLIVVRSTGPDASVTDFGFKRIALPQFQRLGRHHIVMCIDQHCGQPLAYFLLGIHHRITG